MHLIEIIFHSRNNNLQYTYSHFRLVIMRSVSFVVFIIHYDLRKQRLGYERNLRSVKDVSFDVGWFTSFSKYSNLELIKYDTYKQKISKNNDINSSISNNCFNYAVNSRWFKIRESRLN